MTQRLDSLKNAPTKNEQWIRNPKKSSNWQTPEVEYKFRDKNFKVRFRNFNIRSGFTLILILTAVFLSKSAFSQDTDYTDSFLPISTDVTSVSNEVRSLTIGDKVPNLEFKMINSTGKTVKLSDFTNRKRLIILDFWATWCRPCVYNFFKIDTLQELFKDDLQIIAVNSKNTGDTEAYINFFLSKQREKNGQNFNFPFAIDDTLINSLFPHREIPHYVWITSDFVVKAITSSNEVNRKNIQNILEKNISATLPVKQDFPFKKLLYSDLVVTSNNPIYYSILVKGRQDGFPVANRLRLVKNDSNKLVIRGRTMINIPIIQIYETILEQSRKLSDVNSVKRIIFDSLDLSNFIFDSSKLIKEAWEKKNLYTYDIVIPESDAPVLYDNILSDLNKYSDYYARIERREVKCIVLIDKKIDNISNKKIRDLEKEGISISSFIRKLNKLDAFSFPVINKATYKSKIDIDFSRITDINVLKGMLSLYGLDLIIAEEKIDMFVISRRPIKS